MPRHSTRRLENKTRFDKQNRTISWHVALHFHGTDNTVYHLSELCPSGETIRHFLNKFYEENSFKLFMPGQILSRFNGDFQKLSANEDANLNVLFEVRDFRVRKRYHARLGIDSTLEECLLRKTVVEYPVFILALNEDLGGFTLVSEPVKQKEAKKDEEREDGELDDDETAEEGEINDEDDENVGGEMSMLELGNENEEDFDIDDDGEDEDDGEAKKLKIEQLFDIDFSENNADNDFESGVKIEKF